MSGTMATSIVIHLKTCTPVGHDAGIDRWPEGFGIDIFLRRSHVSVPPRLEVLPLSLSLSWFVPIFLNSIAVPWVYKCIVGFIHPSETYFPKVCWHQVEPFVTPRLPESHVVVSKLYQSALSAPHMQPVGRAWWARPWQFSRRTSP